MTQPNANEKDTDPRVWVVIYSSLDKSKVLVGRRTAQCNNAGTYGLFGGHLDEGETPREGAARELLEETGIKVNPKNLKPVVTINRKGTPLHYFEMNQVHLGLQLPQLTSEVDNYLWFDVTTHEEKNEVMEDGVQVPFEFHYSMKKYIKYFKTWR